MPLFSGSRQGPLTLRPCSRTECRRGPCKKKHTIIFPKKQSLPALYSSQIPTNFANRIPVTGGFSLCLTKAAAKDSSPHAAASYFLTHLLPFPDTVNLIALILRCKCRCRLAYFLDQIQALLHFPPQLPSKATGVVLWMSCLSCLWCRGKLS